MGNLGISETIVILGFALILFGPKRLPEIGRVLGNALAQYRRAASDMRRTIEREVDASEIRSAAKSLKDVSETTNRSIWQSLEAATAPAANPQVLPPQPDPQQTPEHSAVAAPAGPAVPPDPATGA